MIRTACLSALALTFSISAAVAGQEIAGKKTIMPEVSPFDKGRMELQIGATAYHSLRDEPIHPEVNDVGGVVRVGWMLGDVTGDGWLRGNWEFLLEAQVSGVVQGPGEILASGGFLFRYNFVKEGSPWVPYIQLGGGGTYSDMHEDLTQTQIGSEWSFNLQGGFGIRYLFTDHCAFFAELMYRHISNADTADRNTGLDSIGAVVGVSLFY